MQVKEAAVCICERKKVFAGRRGRYNVWQDQHQRNMQQAKSYKAVLGREQLKVYISVSKREKEQTVNNNILGFIPLSSLTEYCLKQLQYISVILLIIHISCIIIACCANTAVVHSTR